MRLIVYMQQHRLTDDALASLIEGCTEHAVRKWKYGQREPDAATMVRIAQITGDAVTLKDWAEQAAESRRAREASRAVIQPIAEPERAAS